MFALSPVSPFENGETTGLQIKLRLNLPNNFLLLGNYRLIILPCKLGRTGGWVKKSTHLCQKKEDAPIRNILSINF